MTKRANSDQPRSEATTERHLLIYVAPLLERESDFFKIGHTTTAGLRARQSTLRRLLGQPKLQLYPIIDYPRDAPLSRVVTHERDLVWMVRRRGLALFQHPSPEIRYEIVYFPTTPAMRFWSESERLKRDRSFRVFRRAFILGEEGGSSRPIPLQQVTSLLDEHRKEWERLKEMQSEYSRAEAQQESERLQREWRREMLELDERARQEEQKEKARLEALDRSEAARRIRTF